MRVAVAVLTAVLVTGAAGWAAETASAPAGTQSATQRSWATPKEAYLTYARAMLASDGETLSKSVAWEDPSDAARAKLVTPQDIYGLEIFKLLAQQFPEDAMLKPSLAAMQAGTERQEKFAAEALTKTEALLAKAEVVVEGANATIKMTPIIQALGQDSVKLKLVDGTWRVLPGEVGMPYAPEDAKIRAEMNKQMAFMVRSRDLQKAGQEVFMKELRAKKFATAKEALAAMQKASMEAMKKAAGSERPPLEPGE